MQILTLWKSATGIDNIKICTDASCIGFLRYRTILCLSYPQKAGFSSLLLIVVKKNSPVFARFRKWSLLVAWLIWLLCRNINVKIYMLLNTALIIRNVGSQIQWPCTCQVASSLFPYLSIILSNTGSLRYLWLIQVWSLYRDLYFGWVLLATYIMVSAPRVFIFSNSLNVMTPAEWTNGLISQLKIKFFNFYAKNSICPCTYRHLIQLHSLCEVC